MLWFAFKFVFLYWVIHPILRTALMLKCCDLLSNLYFCIGWYTTASGRPQVLLVVICFQICIFVLGDTPSHFAGLKEKALWFAFKFVFLYWVIHLTRSEIYATIGCDLLSNLYFCIGWYTNLPSNWRKRIVVICFQICIFVLGDTPLPTTEFR